MRYSILILFMLCLIVVGCKTHKKTEKSVVNANFPGPPTIVYKMTKDYSQNVPVTLSDDKLTIVNYPAIEDIVVNGKYPVPTMLNKGYYLDNRGIGPNVAFTKYSYEEYSKLAATPTPDELLLSVIDNDPIVEMYDFGNRLRFRDIEAELNRIIDDGEILKNAKKLK